MPQAVPAFVNAAHRITPMAPDLAKYYRSQLPALRWYIHMKNTYRDYILHLHNTDPAAARRLEDYLDWFSKYMF
jgi:hypothetical protein